MLSVSSSFKREVFILDSQLYNYTVSCILFFFFWCSQTWGNHCWVATHQRRTTVSTQPTIKAGLAISNNNWSSGAYLKDIVTRTRCYASQLFTEQCKTGLVLNLFIASFDKHEAWFQRLCSLISGQLAFISLTVPTNRLPKSCRWFLIRFAEELS